jgi:hypothetical protein
MWFYIISTGEMVLCGTGTMNAVQAFTGNDYVDSLTRPCGLCFDDAGYLYVASLTDEVLPAPVPLHLLSLLLFTLLSQSLILAVLDDLACQSSSHR